MVRGIPDQRVTDGGTGQVVRLAHQSDGGPSRAQDPTVVRDDQPGQSAQQRGFPATVASHDPDAVTDVDPE